MHAQGNTKLKYIAAALLFICAAVQLDSVDDAALRYDNSVVGKYCHTCNVALVGAAFQVSCSACNECTQRKHGVP